MKINDDAEKLLSELIRSQTDLEEKTKAHGNMINVLKFQLNRENVMTQAFNSMKWPMAVFGSNGRITMANPVFCSLTGIPPEDIEKKTYSISDYLNFENAGMSEALQSVFNSPAADLQNLTHPLKIKPGAEGEKTPAYTRAIFYLGACDDNGDDYAAVFFL